MAAAALARGVVAPPIGAFAAVALGAAAVTTLAAPVASAAAAMAAYKPLAVAM